MVDLMGFPSVSTDIGHGQVMWLMPNAKQGTAQRLSMLKDIQSLTPHPKVWTLRQC